MRFTIMFFGFTLFLFVAASCSENSKVAPRNPNGDSELALLMRDMFDDAMEMKEQIEKGRIPETIRRFEEMHTAEATEPDKVAQPIYKTFTDAYQESIDALKNAHLGELDKAFNTVVQSCMTCHQTMCPGPMVKIKRLYIEN